MSVCAASLAGWTMPASASSSLKQTIIATITVLLFVNLQHNASLTSHYGRLTEPHPASTQYDTTAPRAAATLALIDPYFLGGFRNQHMRFVAFIHHAIAHNASQVLLPSIHWGDAYNKGSSLQHEYLFDVRYWNERAEEKGLPRLVGYDAAVLDPGGCFNVSSGLWAGFSAEFLRSNETNLRKWGEFSCACTALLIQYHRFVSDNDELC